MPIFSYSGNLLEGQSQNVVKKKISFSKPVRVLKCVIYVLLLKSVKIKQLVNVISNQSSSEINRSSFVLKKSKIHTTVARCSLHARLNSHCEAQSYKKKKHTKIKAYWKSVYKETIVKSCLLILNLNSFRPYVKGKHSIGREFQSLAVRGKKPLASL